MDYPATETSTKERWRSRAPFVVAAAGLLLVVWPANLQMAINAQRGRRPRDEGRGLDPATTPDTAHLVRAAVRTPKSAAAATV